MDIHFGHKLTRSPDEYNTHYCGICGSKIWINSNYNRFLVCFGTGIWKQDISCDEMIIKNIIE